MQYPVPQFTDVEDKIIGSLTVIQFGILFASGVMVFLFFSVTKSIPVTVVAGMIFGIPGLGLAFAPLNGRPMYRSFGYVMRYQTGPKYMVFHRDSYSIKTVTQKKEVVSEAVAAGPTETTEQRLKEVQELLNKNRQEESDLTQSIVR